jgi:hypothetical protein
MYEITAQELSVFVVLGFGLGVFTSFYLTRLMEVVHLWRLVSETLAFLLLMCVAILEDVEFIRELKRKHLHDSDFTPEQIAQFEEVDTRSLTNWKNSVILSIVTKAPPRFRTLMPFNNWDEAIRFMNTAIKRGE